jgi:hypothetical protein
MKALLCPLLVPLLLLLFSTANAAAKPQKKVEPAPGAPVVEVTCGDITFWIRKRKDDTKGSSPKDGTSSKWKACPMAPSRSRSSTEICTSTAKNVTRRKSGESDFMEAPTKMDHQAHPCRPWWSDCRSSHWHHHYCNRCLWNGPAIG